MKKAALIFFSVLTAFMLHAQNVNFAWAKQMGGTNPEQGIGITVDANGNVYTTGYFSGTADFDPGPGTYNLTSFAYADIFISKLDSSGNFMWAKAIGGADFDVGLSIAVDASGNVYTTGFFKDTADFDPGPGIFNLVSFGDADIFISKLDASGNFIWAKQIGGTDQEQGIGIRVDAGGNVYTTGYFFGTVDFDPGPGVYNLTSLGVEDVFVSKLDASGNFIWAKQFAGTGYELAFSLAIDVNGNVYTTGFFYGTADFDPGPGTYNLTSGSGVDFFVSKLDVSGNFIWAKQFGETTLAQRSSIALDANGNVYITGSFIGTVDFDPGPSTYNLTSFTNNIEDMFISKLDASGNFVWAKQIGGIDQDIGNSIKVDANGNVYTTGHFYGTADFDPGSGTYNLTSTGYGDIFVSKLDASGNFIWAKQLGGTDQEEAWSIAIDVNGNVYTTGLFNGTADFDPGTGIYNITSAGESDIFIHKMGPCVNSTSSTITASACSTYTLNGQTYTATGVYTQTLINSVGCDSIITLNLTINNSAYTTINAAACDSYVWNGQTYTISGTYRDTLATSNGCDSIITLNLVINSRTFSTINAAICPGQIYAGHTTAGTYIDTLVAANGCDSIRTLNLTVKPRSSSTINAAICSGQNYAGHTNAGTYIDTLIAANGCDSIRTLSLSVKPGSFSKIDTAICSGQNYGGHTIAGAYTDILIAANGCDSVRTVNLTVKNNCSIYIPNSFTPNNDGLNDLFKPTTNLPLKKFSFIIFNRYGEKIFETYEYGRGWDGTYKGKAQPTGSYVYRIKFTNISGYESENNGSVLLLR